MPNEPPAGGGQELPLFHPDGEIVEKVVGIVVRNRHNVTESCRKVGEYLAEQLVQEPKRFDFPRMAKLETAFAALTNFLCSDDRLDISHVSADYPVGSAISYVGKLERQARRDAEQLTAQSAELTRLQGERATAYQDVHRRLCESQAAREKTEAARLTLTLTSLRRDSQRKS